VVALGIEPGFLARNSDHQTTEAIMVLDAVAIKEKCVKELGI
jgi:hypothetical protein